MDPEAMFCPACGTAVGDSGTQRPPRRKNLSKRWIIAGPALVLCLVVMAVDFKLFLRLVAIGGTVLFMLFIVVMLLTFKKAKSLSPASLVISILLSLVTFWVYSLFLGVPVSGPVQCIGLLSGVLIGVGWALITPVKNHNGIVKREGNAWYLAVWGVVFAINQLASILTGRPPRIGMVLLLLGTGIVLGTSSSLIAMFYRAKSPNADALKVMK